MQADTWQQCGMLSRMEPPVTSVRPLKRPPEPMARMTIRLPKDMRDALYAVSKECGYPPSLLARRAMYLGLKKATSEAVASLSMGD